MSGRAAVAMPSGQAAPPPTPAADEPVAVSVAVDTDAV